MTRSERAQLIGIVFLGVALRFAFLLWSGVIEPRADEGQYVYQALAWNHFGFYLGSPNWVWPPGYPAYLAPFFRLFAEDGLFAAKLGQVLLSSVVGGSIVLIARRVFAWRAARVAGLLWAFYLPLIGFTHYLWPETVFLAVLLPAVLLFLTVVDGDAPTLTPRAAALRCAATGALIGVTCLFKEAPLPLLVLLPAILLAARRRTASLPDRVGLSAVLVLSAAVVLVPWSLRTYEVYGRVVPSGATLGENLFQGVNTTYFNYDYGGVNPTEVVGRDSLVFRALLEPPAGLRAWARSSAPNAVDKNAENVARAKRFVRAAPGYYLRTRVKKLADWVTPLNFFQRHQRLNVYRTSLATGWAKRPLVLLSVALTGLVLAGSIGGLFLTRLRGPARLVLGAVIVTFLAGVAVVSMSRYRVQVEPVLIVLTAGFLTRRADAREHGRLGTSALARRLALGAWVLLGALWALNAPEILDALRRSL